MLKKISRINSTKHRCALAIEFAEIRFARKSTAAAGAHVLIVFEKGEKKVSTAEKVVEEAGTGAMVAIHEMINFNVTLYKDKDNHTAEKSCEFTVRQKLHTRVSDIGKFALKLHELEEMVPVTLKVPLQTKNGTSLNATVELIVTMSPAVAGDDSSSRASSEFSRESLGGGSSFSMSRVLPMSRARKNSKGESDSERGSISGGGAVSPIPPFPTSPVRTVNGNGFHTADASELTSLRHELQKALADKENVQQYHQDTLAENQGLKDLIEVMKKNRKDDISQLEGELAIEQNKCSSKEAEIAELRRENDSLNEAISKSEAHAVQLQSEKDAAEMQIKLCDDQMKLMRSQLDAANKDLYLHRADGEKSATSDPSTTQRRSSLQFLDDNEYQNLLKDLESERTKVRRVQEQNAALVLDIEELLANSSTASLTPRTLQGMQESSSSDDAIDDKMQKALKLIADLETRNRAYASTIAVLESSKSDLNREQGRLLDEIDELKRAQGDFTGVDDPQFSWMKQSLGELDFSDGVTPTSPGRSPREGANYSRSRLSSTMSITYERRQTTSDLSAELRIAELEGALFSTKDELEKAKKQEEDVHELPRANSDVDSCTSDINVLKRTISELESRLESRDKDLVLQRRDSLGTMTAGKAYYEGVIADQTQQIVGLEKSLLDARAQAQESGRSRGRSHSGSGTVVRVRQGSGSISLRNSSVRTDGESFDDEDDLEERPSFTTPRGQSNSPKGRSSTQPASTFRSPRRASKENKDALSVWVDRLSPVPLSVDTTRSPMAASESWNTPISASMLDYFKTFSTLWVVLEEAVYGMKQPSAGFKRRCKSVCMDTLPPLDSHLAKLLLACKSDDNNANSEFHKVVADQRKWVNDLKVAMEKVANLDSSDYEVEVGGGARDSSCSQRSTGSNTAASKLFANIGADDDVDMDPFNNDLDDNVDMNDGGSDDFCRACQRKKKVDVAAVVPESTEDDFDPLQVLIGAKIDLAEALENNDKLQKEYRSVERLVCDYKLQRAELMADIDDKNAEIVALTKTIRLLKK